MTADCPQRAAGVTLRPAGRFEFPPQHPKSKVASGPSKDPTKQSPVMAITVAPEVGSP